VFAQIEHGNAEAFDHLVEHVAEEIEVRSLTENREEACEVPSVGHSVFALDADEQAKGSVALEFAQTSLDAVVSENDGQEKHAPENGDGIGVTSVVSPLSECVEKCVIGDGFEGFPDGGQ
jgi:hypothetical protein